LSCDDRSADQTARRVHKRFAGRPIAEKPAVATMAFCMTMSGNRSPGQLRTVETSAKAGNPVFWRIAIVWDTPLGDFTDLDAFQRNLSLPQIVVSPCGEGSIRFDAKLCCQPAEMELTLTNPDGRAIGLFHSSPRPPPCHPVSGQTVMSARRDRDHTLQSWHRADAIPVRGPMPPPCHRFSTPSCGILRRHRHHTG